MPPGTRPPGVPARALRTPLRLCGRPVPATAHQNHQQRGRDRRERQDPDPREAVRLGACRAGSGRGGRLGQADADADRLRSLGPDLNIVADAQLGRPGATVREGHLAVGDPVQVGGARPHADDAPGAAAERDQRMTPDDRLRLRAPAAAWWGLAHRDDGEIDLLAGLRRVRVGLELDAGLGVGECGSREKGRSEYQRDLLHARIPRPSLSSSSCWWKSPTLNLWSRLYSPILMAHEDLSYDSFPDLGALTDEELKQLIQQHTEEEQEVSYRRRILHGKIDILRAELVNRLRKKHQEGESVITGADVQQLTDILAGKSAPDADSDTE